METFSFPRYEVDELLAHIRNSILTGADGKNLSKTDLCPNPKPEVLRAIYMRVLVLVFGMQPEDFYKLPACGEVPYPQTMQGFLFVSNLFRHLKPFMHICRVSDFEMADLLHPKAKRTIRFLSAIVNFIHFRESCCENYMEFLWQHEAAASKMSQLERAKEEALQRLEELKLVPADQQAEVQQLEDDIQERQRPLSHLQRKSMQMQETNAQKKHQIAEKTRRRNELKLSLASAKELQEGLKAKVVDSPEKLKRENEQMKDTVQKFKTSLREVRDRRDQYRDAVEGLPKCQLEAQRYLRKAQELADSRDGLAQTSQENLMLEDQVESAQLALRRLKGEESALRRQRAAKEEKLATVQLRARQKRQDTERHKRALTEDCQRLQAERDAVCARVETLTQEAQRGRLSTQQLRDAAERERLKSREISVKLKAGLDKYHEGLERASAEGRAALQRKVEKLRTRLYQANTGGPREEEGMGQGGQEGASSTQD
ncbi:kinetochore protein Nuf2-like isoform X3 [Sorex araneus]|uniref:kinetochore protein Nuf2-like isoform X3 n=1 Tax=Sorex araneus TaxID=42254 RepID=UPI002433D07B|nr:kinetochore protein Nuf2-like isoform X3 [Sorex araneus]